MALPCSWFERLLASAVLWAFWEADWLVDCVAVLVDDRASATHIGEAPSVLYGAEQLRRIVTDCPKAVPGSAAPRTSAATVIPAAARRAFLLLNRVIEENPPVLGIAKPGRRLAATPESVSETPVLGQILRQGAAGEASCPLSSFTNSRDEPR